MSATDKFQSAIRWGKDVSELNDLLTANPDVLNAANEANGNCAIHLAAQNNHLHITKWLLEKGADVNAQNGKGQTALHMSAGYDMFEQTDFLIAKGADRKIKNGDGHTAESGIEGDKVGANAIGGGLYLLKAAESGADCKKALEVLKTCNIDEAKMDKAQLVQTGMAKKKLYAKDGWDQAMFMEVMQRF